MKKTDVRWIVVHCSKTAAHQGDGVQVVDRKCRLRGALSCGYHFVICRDGTVEKGRKLTEPGNHLIGYNKNSIAICVVGMPASSTREQRASLRDLLSRLKTEFPWASAITHSDLQPRTAGRAGCPGFKLNLREEKGRDIR
jgi:N-acetylmuramoyl-L-alanine amidase